MHRIDNSTAVTVMPIRKPAGTDGYFTQGSMTTGQLATIVEADILNAIMMEISNVVTRAGITLNKTDDTQLWQAIQGLMAGPAGGDLTGRYPNPTFNLSNGHIWAAPQGLNNQVPLMSRDTAGNLRNMLYMGNDNRVYLVGAQNGMIHTNAAQTANNMSLDDAGNVSVRNNLSSYTINASLDIAAQRNISASNQVYGNTVVANAITSNGDIAAAGQVRGAYVYSYGDIQAAGHLYAGGGIDALNGNVTANGGRLRASYGAYQSGDGATGTLLQDFPNGGSWTRLPNGVIIQWGTAVVSGGHMGYNTFPVAFPNGVATIVVTEAGAGGWDNSGYPGRCTVYATQLIDAGSFYCSCVQVDIYGGPLRIVYSDAYGKFIAIGY